MEINTTTERGAVALITAMIVSILLMITTAGMVSLTVKSMRQSTDGAQSTKAYYAAEGGLEEALLALRNDPNFDGNCDGAESGTSAKDGVVTCTKVSSDTNVLQSVIPAADQAVQLDLSAVAGMASIKIEWGLPSERYDANSIPRYSTPNAGSNFPASTAWPSTAPAVMEVGLVEYPAGQTFKISDVQFFQPNFMPFSNKAGASPVSNNGFPVYAYTALSDAPKPFIVSCSGAAPYQCSGGVAINPSKKYVVRLKTRYNGASYRVTAQGGNNAALNIPGAMYTIDVTARAGDTFRRIQTSFPKGQQPTALSSLDYVLYSDTNICKSFKVKAGVATALDCPVP